MKWLQVAGLFLGFMGVVEGRVSPEVEVLQKGLGIPWGMDFLSPGTLIFTEREGKMSLLDIATGRLTQLKNVPEVYHRGQGGLLDVMVHRGKVYFTYSKKQKRFRYTTALSVAKVGKNKLYNVREIFVANAFSSNKRHFGSRLLHWRGHLYLTVGDRGERDKAQDLNVHNGKVLRLRMDGGIPSDNPFGKSAVWSYGHRNPQGLDVHRERGEIWVQEHGPRGGDEINVLVKGGNYGWPVITYGREYWGPKIGEGYPQKGDDSADLPFYPFHRPLWNDILHGRAFERLEGVALFGRPQVAPSQRFGDRKGKGRGRKAPARGYERAHQGCHSGAGRTPLFLHRQWKNFASGAAQAQTQAQTKTKTKTVTASCGEQLSGQNQDAGDVVRSSVDQGGLNQVSDGVLHLFDLGLVRVGDVLVDDGDQMGVRNHAVESVRTEDKNVVVLNFVVEDVYLDVIVKTHRLGQDIFASIQAGIVAGVDSQIDFFLDQGVIPGNLKKHFTVEQIGAGIPHIAYIQVGILKDESDEGGTHSRHFVFFQGIRFDFPIGVLEGLADQFPDVRFRMGGKKFHKFVYGHTGGNFSRLVSPHSVGHQEEVLFRIEVDIVLIDFSGTTDIAGSSGDKGHSIALCFYFIVGRKGAVVK